MENVFLKFAVCLTILVAVPAAVNAQNEILVPDDFATRISTSRDASVLGTDLFGDHTEIGSGSTEFVVTDVELPGNNSLSVAIRRRFLINEDYIGFQGGPFESEIEVPRLHGVFADNPPSNPSTFNGWTSSAFGHPEQRCSVSLADYYPRETLGDQPIGTWEYHEFWHGNQLYVPGRGDQQMQIAGGAPSDPYLPGAAGNYHWVTKDRWYFSCLPTTKNGVPGEGFLAFAPDGKKYYFDWIVKKRPARTLKKPAFLGRDSVSMPDASRTNRLARAEYWILPTRIEDRFGNFVEYFYTGSRLDAITASDGRFLAFDYSLPRTSLTDGLRRWYYDVNAQGMTITYPDSSIWNISISHDLRRRSVVSSCGPHGPIFLGQAVVTINHPSGAKGEFTMQPIQRGLSYVPENCIDDDYYGTYYYQYPKILDGIALTKKEISGPGLSTMTWNHAYGPMNESFSNECTAECPTTRYVDVSGPNSTFARYTFGNRWHDNEGLLLKAETGSSAQNILRTDSHAYDVNPTSPPYADPVGYPASGAGDDWAHVRIRPLRSHSVVQQGVTFLTSVNSLDALARPVSLTKASSLGFSRSETLAYEDNVQKYVLGQIRSITKTSPAPAIVVAKTTYSPTTALPEEIYSFGVLQRRLGFCLSATENCEPGTLHTVADDANHVTTYNSWKRGMPQQVIFADNSIESAVVNDLGQVDSTTDENGYTTTYLYDFAGRLKKISHPTDDTVAWADTSIVYEKISNAEVGISANHWRRTESTGNAKKIAYFDALWRPIVTTEYDSGTQSTTQRYVNRKFDHDGRETFTSYPSTSFSSGIGVDTSYDALGRTRSVSRDSELGLLVTNYEYLSPFKTRVIDPRNGTTTTSFQVFDSPSEDAPVSIEMPEGASVAISRDIFGKPETIMRSGVHAGAIVSATRSYIYDSNQRLCKTIEPESGATLLDYDAAGNVGWVTKGSSLTSLTCDRSSVPSSEKSVLTHDGRNRLTGITHPIGTSSIGRTYWPDGALKTTTTNGATWTYQYNKRRLLETESLAFDGQSFLLDWSYDSNGAVSQLMYPDDTLVNFTPNALGQPTKAGNFATAVAYWPNGAIKSFNYGNGLPHTLTQNTRQLPLRSKDGAVTDLTYVYDGNANVRSITDNAQAGLETRSMSYDLLDRLTSASAPSLWGSASYTYDPIDNLRTSTLGPRQYTHAINSRNRLESLSGSGPTIGYAYDARGNAISRGGQAFVFDRANRLTAATGKEQYTYDGHGRRIRILRSADNAKNYQVYGRDGQLLFGLETPSGKTTSYVYLNGSLVARNESGAGNPGLPAPSNLRASPNPSSTGAYSVSWDAVTGAASYLLTEAYNGGAPVTVFSGAARTWATTGKAAGSYVYRVQACNSTCGAQSPPVTQTVLGLASPTMNLPSPNPSTDGNYRVSWSAVTGATSYKLEERIGSTWSVVPAVNGNFKDFIGRSSGAYGYRVQACNSRCSTYSNEVVETVSTQGGTTPAAPATITGPTGCASTPRTFSIGWTSSANATRYELHEWNDAPVGHPGHVDHLVDLVPPLRTSITLQRSAVQGMGGSTIYSYEVRACADGCSAWRGPANVCVGIPSLFNGPATAIAATTTYIHTDGLGSPIAETDASGNVTKRMRYEPYGAPTTGTYEQGPGYTGHVTDAATGLSYMQQRYYDPIAGRFLSVDPVTVDTVTGWNFNRYNYANNNPCKYVDPDGRYFETAWDAFNIALGVQSLSSNVQAGNWGGAALDAGGIVVDTAAALLPVVPGGAGAAIKAARLAENVAQGAMAEKTVARELGEQVAGQRVTLEASTGQRSVADIVTKDKGVVEVKSGNAQLSPGQKSVKADIDAGRLVTPRGKNAEKVGLEPGKPTQMKCYDEKRC